MSIQPSFCAEVPGNNPPWWVTLEALSQVFEASGRQPCIHPLDFLYCGTLERVGLPRLHLYRHVHTRRALALDERLHAWRSAPGTPGAVQGYLPVPSLADAVAALDLERGRAASRRSIALRPERDSV